MRALARRFSTRRFSTRRFSVRRPAMHGFTLVELIIAVTVLGMIIGPLTASATFFMAHGEDASQRFADDTSIRSVLSLFTTDAQSAESVTVPDASPCGAATPAIATLTWTDGGTVFRASWSTQTSGGTTTLVRRRCTGTTLVSTLLVADVQAAPTVSCAPSCANASTITMIGTGASGAGFSVVTRRRSS
jgi:prepilin-type N-terminal cleavage/methylation domain-containing protein